MAPLIETAGSLTGRTYVPGDYEHRESFALRVLAEHARSAAMLVGDGVFPSNEARGFVLRRIIRRAVRYAYLLGTEQLVMPTLADVAVTVMGHAYPDVARQRDFIVGVLGKEEERFRQTLRNGLSILEAELAGGNGELSGSTAFALHDTYGFPLELTQEIAGERDVTVDVEGFEVEMGEQRRRAKAARQQHGDDANIDAYREVVEQFGTTTFTGYLEDATESRLLAVLPSAADPDLVELFLDRTPFYAESGGQVGDRGTIRTETGGAEVLDTTFALPNLRRHLARLTDGTITPGQLATAAIDVPRRDATRRNHTATHLLHHALREVLGDHVKQAGSLVAPDRLRFDFSHYEPVTSEQIEEIERIANAATLANTGVRAFETSKAEAEQLGRDRLLRRQVRRHRARPGGRSVGRAVRRHPRPGDRRHRHDQGRQRGLDRLEPAAHRGHHRRGQRGPAAARRAGARRCRPDARRVRRRRPGRRAAQARRGPRPRRRAEGAARQARRRPGQRAGGDRRRRRRRPARRRPRHRGPAGARARRPRRARRRHRRARRCHDGGRREPRGGGDAGHRDPGVEPAHGRRTRRRRRERWQGRRGHGRRARSVGHRRRAAHRLGRGGRRRADAAVGLPDGASAGCAPSDSTSDRSASASPSATARARSPRRSRSSSGVGPAATTTPGSPSWCAPRRPTASSSGMPHRLAGGDGPAARAARAEATALASVVGVPVETYDERFTTVTANRVLAESGVRGRGAASRSSTRWRRRSSSRRGSTPEGAHVTIADELARERAAARRERDVAAARGIDDLDSLESLDMLDWSTDPWDDAEAAGAVERLRWQTRSVKWVAYTVLALLTVIVLVAGIVGWWYIHQINPAGDPSEAVAVHDQRRRHPAVGERPAGGAGLRRGRRRLPLVHEPPRRARARARLLRAAHQRPHGQPARSAAHAARRDLHQGDVPRGLHGAADRGPPGAGHGDDDRRRRAGGDGRPVARAQPAPARRDVASRGCCSRTRTRSRTGSRRPTSSAGWSARWSASVSQEDILTKGQARGRSPYEILIIASLIEREAKTEADRPKIARVIYNRLARGMPLAIDAAVLYGTAAVRWRPGGDPVRRAAPDARPVEHVPERRAAGRRRSPTPGGRRSGPR